MPKQNGSERFETSATIEVSDTLKDRMEAHLEVNWSKVCRQGFRRELTTRRKLALIEQLPEDNLSAEEIADLARLLAEGE